MKRQALLVIVLICNCALVAFQSAAETQSEQRTNSNFFDQEKVGWHWYLDPKRDKQDEKANQQNIDMDFKNMSPTDKVEYLREQQQQTLHKALISPTRENVIEYLKVQQIILDKSNDFTNIYRQVIQTTPLYNGTINYPISQTGSQIYHANLEQERHLMLSSINKTHGLFYFYKAGCPYCERFAPVIKKFVSIYKIELIPVSLDGHKSPDFPESKINQAIATKLQIQSVPALYLVEPKAQKFIPVSFGFTTLDTLKERMHLIIMSITQAKNAVQQNQNKEIAYKSESIKYAK